MARKRVVAEYQVVSGKGRRAGQTQFRLVKSESAELPPSKASELAANAHDACHNFTLAAWALKTHLDHVTRFVPQAHTGSTDLDRLVELRLRRASRRENFSANGLMSRDDALRLLESACVLDGDGLWSILADGTVQGIEGSRICLPGAGNYRAAGEWAGWDEDGILRTATGRHRKYSICRYDTLSNQMVPDVTLAADDAVIYCWWPRRFDQGRGVSPFAPALNSLRDLYAGIEYTLLKMKLHAMLGVVITREAVGAEMGALGTTSETESEDDDGNTVTQVDIDLRDGIAMFDMDPGEGVQFLDSQTPTPSVAEYQKGQTRFALRALDIPYSMWDPTGANFAQRKADAAAYWEAGEWRRAQLRDVLRQWGDWQYRNWAAQDTPEGATFRAALKVAGVSASDLAEMVAWEPRDVSSLAKPDAAEIGARIALGQTTYQAEAARWGGDFAENVRLIGEALATAGEHGVPLSMGQPGQQLTTDTADDTADGTEEADDAETD